MCSALKSNFLCINSVSDLLSSDVSFYFLVPAPGFKITT
jgi:hypothetical protein